MFRIAEAGPFSSADQSIANKSQRLNGKCLHESRIKFLTTSSRRNDQKSRKEFSKDRLEMRPAGKSHAYKLRRPLAYFGQTFEAVKDRSCHENGLDKSWLCSEGRWRISRALDGQSVRPKHHFYQKKYVVKTRIIDVRNLNFSGSLLLSNADVVGTSVGFCLLARIRKESITVCIAGSPYVQRSFQRGIQIRGPKSNALNASFIGAYLAWSSK